MKKKVSKCHRTSFQEKGAEKICKKCNKECSLVKWRSHYVEGEPPKSEVAIHKIGTIKKIFIIPLKGNFDREDKEAVEQHNALRGAIHRLQIELGISSHPEYIGFVISRCILLIAERLPRYRRRIKPHEEIKMGIALFLASIKK